MLINRKIPHSVIPSAHHIDHVSQAQTLPLTICFQTAKSCAYSFLRTSVASCKTGRGEKYTKSHDYYIIFYCTMFGLLDHFWPPVVPCYSTEDAVRIINSFITIPITRNYNHSQLFLTLCHIYTAHNHTRSWLQSLITLLHWLTSQISISVSNYHTLYIFTLAENLLREFTS
jgi:hypothetical protein